MITIDESETLKIFGDNLRKLRKDDNETENNQK
ncbi:hypothetical protein SAMN05518672_104475 [Chitinophaga sp. CF118]|nr:hypothetical protein SAMN05518672_104475 [Chitinophaga sp. CF118]